jgi:hypothetical protein
MRTVWPGIQPRSFNPPSKAAREGTTVGDVDALGISTPIVGTRAGA